MILQLQHQSTHRDDELLLIGISDWELDTNETTVFLPVSTKLDDVPDELGFNDWLPKSGSDSTWYTDAAGDVTEYLEEVIELNSEKDDVTVWVIPSETYPVLTREDWWGDFYPDQNTVKEMTE